MSLFSDWSERLRALAFRRRRERELAEELEFHLERETEERVRGGAAPEAARREARLAFGGVELYKEAVRDAGGVRPLQELGADLRYALRGLRRNPGFTATAVLVLGLGLGATTAVFSVMDSVILAELPYPEADRLARVVEQNSPTNRWALSTADVTAIREQQTSFEAWGAAQRDEAALSGPGRPERIAVGRASAGYMQAIGIPVARGRPIETRDEAPEAPAVVVVSHALAGRLLGGTERALGRSLNLDGISHQVIGVLPPGRDELGGLRATAWPALRLRPPTFRGPFWLRGIGRLRPGVTIEGATRELAVVSVRLLDRWPFPDHTARLTPVPLRETIVGRAGRQVGLFAGAVALVLLLAITNVATLVLVRASAREPELALRIMLGAGRGRLARLLVTENVLLTLAAGVLGLALAALGVRLAVTQLADLPRIDTAALDWRATTFAFSAALVSGLLVSLSPLAALSRHAAGSLRADARRAGLGPRTHAVRSALVTAEFALALPLLAGAGLLLNSFLRLARVDPGFDPAGLVSVGVSLPEARYPGTPEVQRFWRLAEQRLSEIPGVTAAGLATEIPPDLSGGNDNFNLVDHPVPPGQAEPNSPWYYVTAGYFRALGVPLLDGRLMTPADTADAYPVVVVSHSWARRYFPNEQATGRRLIQGGCSDCPRTTIIGVVGDIKNLGPAGAEEAVYGPVVQSNARAMNLVVRSGAAPALAFAALREQMAGLDPELPLAESLLAERLHDSLADPRRWAAVLAAFAAAGMGLAALGVFGLMSYIVRQRRREIGVRLALGARPASVTRLIISRGMRYALAGSGIGLAVTLAVAHKLGTLLFQVSPTDAGTIAAVALLLLLAGLVACWLPGRRAARIRPIEAISSE
ncbi:MAG TPA: ADOP family duplicated permease [Gemmatimonadales bacterium]|jgi:predicted permease|nr:ADOP family duplicated permease [Gemmatimonadales bacterium]